jgi:hypothetical protein
VRLDALKLNRAINDFYIGPKAKNYRGIPRSSHNPYSFRGLCLYHAFEDLQAEGPENLTIFGIPEEGHENHRDSRDALKFQWIFLDFYIARDGLVTRRNRVWLRLKFLGY